MTVNKRKKNSRHRGLGSHGWGSKKKHRGHGSRGGSGLAGTGKRADSKKPSFWQNTYFGKFGFERNVTLKPNVPTNIRDIELNISNYIEQKLVTKEGDMIVIDLGKLGFTKLLGDGKASHKYKITAKFASKIAIDKIKEAGGSVTATVKKKEKKKKTEKKADKNTENKTENKPIAKKAAKADEESEE